MREPKALDTTLYQQQVYEQRCAKIYSYSLLSEPGYYDAERGFGIRLETVMMARYSEKPKVS